MAITRVETLTYNGFTFPVESYITSSINYVTDQAGRVVIYAVHRFRVQAVVIAAPGFNNDANLTNIRRRLSVNGAPLLFTAVGYGPMSVNVPGGPQDVKWGPFPKVTQWEPLSPNSAAIEWSCEVAIAECVLPVDEDDDEDDFGTIRRLLAYNYGISTSVDEQGYTTRTISGYLEIPMTRDITNPTRVPDTADNFWDTDTCPKCPDGFRRVSEQTSISYDKRRLDFTVTDVELPENFFPPGVTECRASHVVQGQGPVLNMMTATIRASYTLVKGVPKALAFFYFIKLVNARVTAQLGKQVVAVIPRAISVEEPDIYGRQAGNFSITYTFVMGANPGANGVAGAGNAGAPGGGGGGGGAAPGGNAGVPGAGVGPGGAVRRGLADVIGGVAVGVSGGGIIGGIIGGALAASGSGGQGGQGGGGGQPAVQLNTNGFIDKSALWTTPPDSSYSKWRASIPFLMDKPRGLVGLRSSGFEDKIISLCDNANPPPNTGTFLRTRVLGVSSSILTEFPSSGVAPLPSYFGLRLYSDTNQAVLKFLPTTGASTGNSGTSSFSTVGAGDFFSGLNVTGDMLRVKSPDVVRRVGKLQEVSGVPEDTLVTRGSPTLYAILTYSIEQVGPAPKPPTLTAIDGMSKVQYVSGASEIAVTGNYSLIINGQESPITASRLTGFSVYRILDPNPDASSIQIPPNFFLSDYGNVANYFAR